MKRVASLLLLALSLVAVAHGHTPSAQAQTALDWRGCGGGFECASFAVPVDYSQPNGQSINLALIRLPATDRSKRVGSLFVNPGGPGGSGIDFARGWAPGVDADVRSRFDIVSFDPRGVGQSAPITCHSNLQQYVAADPTPDTQAEWDTLRAVTKAMADECASKYGALLPFLGTKNVARDLDRMRAAVGDDRLTYLGFSYGTSIGQVYADMFPTRVRALVLDGAVDNALSTDDRTLTQAIGFERALQNFVEDCRKNQCALAKRGDPEGAIDDLFAKAEAAPIPAKGRDRPAGPGEVLLGVLEPLYSQQAWPVLTRAIDAGLNGDGSLLVTLTDAYLQRAQDGSYPNLIEANTAVNCIDGGPSMLPTTFAGYPEAEKRFAEEAPHFGPAFASGLPCLDWRAPADPLTAPTAGGAPPILVVSTTADPATPYEWGVALSKQLQSGVLLTFRGDGHTAYGGDECIDDAVNGYLVALTVPSTGTTCGDGPAAPGQEQSDTATPVARPSRPAGGDTAEAAPRSNDALERSLIVLGVAIAVAGAIGIAVRR